VGRDVRAALAAALAPRQEAGVVVDVDPYQLL